MIVHPAPATTARTSAPRRMGPRDNRGNPFLSWYPRASENDHGRGFPRACCRVSRPGSGDRRETAVPAAALLATEPGHQLSPLLPKIRLGVGLHRRRRHACGIVLDPDHAIPRHDLNVGCAERQKQELCLWAALLPPRAVSPDTPSRSSILWRPPAADSLVPRRIVGPVSPSAAICPALTSGVARTRIRQ